MMINEWQCFTLLLIILNYIMTWMCWHVIYVLALVFWPVAKTTEEKNV
jgi:hypothetical protein